MDVISQKMKSYRDEIKRLNEVVKQLQEQLKDAVNDPIKFKQDYLKGSKLI